MALEIERKFLVKNDHWRDQIVRSARMRQGYLISDEINSIRVRVADGQAELNIKSATQGMSRQEYDYPIPLADAEEILDTLCRGPLVEKTRYWVRNDNHIWEIDVFEGANDGLVVAEVELDSADEDVPLPAWVSAEVTDDIRYYNASLASRPFKDW